MQYCYVNVNLLSLAIGLLSCFNLTHTKYYFVTSKKTFIINLAISVSVLPIDQFQAKTV